MITWDDDGTNPVNWTGVLPAVMVETSTPSMLTRKIGVPVATSDILTNDEPLKEAVTPLAAQERVWGELRDVDPG